MFPYIYSLLRFFKDRDLLNDLNYNLEEIFNKFNWKPSVKIDEGLKMTFDYFKSNL